MYYHFDLILCTNNMTDSTQTLDKCIEYLETPINIKYHNKLIICSVLWKVIVQIKTKRNDYGCVNEFIVQWSETECPMLHTVVCLHN